MLTTPVRPSLLENSVVTISDSDVLVIDTAEGVVKMTVGQFRAYINLQAEQPGGVIFGSGSPEGAVTALQGVPYYDDSNKVYFIKRTSGGNTGWGVASLPLTAQLKNLVFPTVTRDADGVPSSATVIWPDGSAGVFTTTSKNADPPAVNAFTVTHVASGKTITQAAVTRDEDGAVIAQPTPTIA